MLRVARRCFRQLLAHQNNIATLKAIFSKYRLQRGNEKKESLAEREKEGKPERERERDRETEKNAEKGTF